MLSKNVCVRVRARVCVCLHVQCSVNKVNNVDVGLRVLEALLSIEDRIIHVRSFCSPMGECVTCKGRVMRICSCVCVCVYSFTYSTFVSFYAQYPSIYKPICVFAYVNIYMDVRRGPKETVPIWHSCHVD